MNNSLIVISLVRKWQLPKLRSKACLPARCVGESKVQLAVPRLLDADHGIVLVEVVAIGDVWLESFGCRTGCFAERPRNGATTCMENMRSITLPLDHAPAHRLLTPPGSWWLFSGQPRRPWCFLQLAVWVILKLPVADPALKVVDNWYILPW